MNPKDKLGSRKPSISLIPPSAIVHVSDAFKEGAEKYGPYNWRKEKVSAVVYIDAILRHVLALIDGEDIDPESTRNKHHMAGVMASASIYIDAMETGNLVDDRPYKGRAAEIIRERTKTVNRSLETNQAEYNPAFIKDKIKKNEDKELDLFVCAKELEESDGTIFVENRNYIDDSACISMEEHHKKLADPNNNYGRGYNK